MNPGGTHEDLTTWTFERVGSGCRRSECCASKWQNEVNARRVPEDAAKADAAALSQVQLVF